MMTRRFFFTVGLAVGFTLVLPFLSAGARAWASSGDDKKDDKKDKDKDDHDDNHDDDDDDDDDVTICDHGHTREVKRKNLAKALAGGATRGACPPSPRR